VARRYFMKIKMKYIDVTELLDIINKLEEALVPGFEPAVKNKLVDAMPPISGFLKIIFATTLEDFSRASVIMRDSPREVREDVSQQLATCRHLCALSTENGWKDIAIPDNLALFFSEMPKNFLYQMNRARYEKGTRPTGDDFVEFSFADAGWVPIQ
jgi:hypothetical protein